MSRLSAQTIEGYCQLFELVTPFREEHLQPCSYDLAVDADFSIEPGEFKLISTEEYVNLPTYLSGKVEGRSSMGRKGIFVIVASGFVDAGFQGNLTLECHNVSPFTHAFKKGTRVAQIVFDELDHPTVKPYQGRYQGQVGVTDSKMDNG